jgi:hypothetical protein
LSLTEAEAEVAASVAQALMSDFIGAPAPVVEAQEEVPASSPVVENDTAPEVTEVAEAPSFEYEPEVPEDILAELNEAEIDEEVEREIAARTPEEDEYGVAEDEESVRERVKLQKRNEYLEKELAKTKSTSWKEEAKKYFPLSEHALDDIKATSRRSFLKQAKAQHEAILPHVQKVLADAKSFVDAEKAAGRADGKAAAAAAFGQPLSGPDINEIDQAAAEATITAAREDARKSGSLTNLFRTMIASGK